MMKSIPSRLSGGAFRWSRLAEWADSRRDQLLLVAASFVLLLPNLGNAFPQVDEANTMIIAQNVLRFGYPTVWDGEYLVSPYFDGDLTEDKVWISHPWLQFYVTAASFALFGPNTWAARLPYALVGVFTVLALYHLAKQMSGSVQLARLSAWLLLLHPGFLLAARQTRYHSLTFLFSVLAVLMFLRWLQEPKGGNLIGYVLASALLFHAYYPYWVFLTFGLVLYLVLVERRWKLMPAFLLGTLGLALLTIPWYAYANPQPPADTGPELSTWGRHLVIYLWKINNWVAPLFSLSVLAGALFLLRKAGWLRKDLKEGISVDKSYLIFAFVLLYTAFISIIPILTTQYVSPAIPLLTILAAHLLWKIREYRRWVGAVVLSLFVTTNVIHTAPYIAAAHSGIPARKLEPFLPNARCNFLISPSLEHYLKDHLVVRFDLFEQAASLFLDYDNRIEGIIRYLNQHASKDQTVYTSWGDANAVRFYTGMKVVYNFFPRFENPEVKSLVERPGTQVDWVVPDTLRFYPPQDPFFKIDLEEYEKVPVHFPKSYFDNTFNQDEATFRTDRNVPQTFFLLRRKSAEHELGDSLRGDR